VRPPRGVAAPLFFSKPEPIRQRKHGKKFSGAHPHGSMGLLPGSYGHPIPPPECHSFSPEPCQTRGKRINPQVLLPRALQAILDRQDAIILENFLRNFTSRQSRDLPRWDFCGPPILTLGLRPGLGDRWAVLKFLLRSFVQSLRPAYLCGSSSYLLSFSSREFLGSGFSAFEPTLAPDFRKIFGNG
jgi:hypothetical protein